MPLPDIPVPTPSAKMETPPFEMSPFATLQDITPDFEAITSVYPLTFEELGQRNGFVLYSTVIPFQPSDPAVLAVNGLGDRGQVFVDWVIILSIFFTRN